MASTPEKTFDLTGGESTVLYLNAHPSYDAVRVDVEGGTGSADLTYKVADEDQFDNVDFASMDQVDSATGLGSGSSDGSKALARTVAVEVVETTGTDPVDGRVYLHSASDPAQNADAFLQR